MLGNSNANVHQFRILVAISFAAAYVGWAAPSRRMPLDFYNMMWWSVPLACLWVLTIGFSAYRFGKKALWMLLGAPLVLYWPFWLVLNGLPRCYYNGNCQ